ncbi:hypothetical protein [Clostridium felsineum]
MKISKWNALCYSFVTIIFFQIMEKVPLYPLNTVKGLMESFGHFLMCIVIFRYYNRELLI